MFRGSEPEPVSSVDDTLVGLIPLSVLALNLPEPPEGCAVFLGRRAIAFVPDDLGRDCVRRQDARRLLDEQRADELRRAKLAKLAEQEAVEADAAWRASLPGGLPASAIPEGVTYGDLVRQAAKDAQPRRRRILEESLAGETMVFHSYQDEEAS